MRLSRLLNALPHGFDLTLADIGSAGGLKANWVPFRSVVTGFLFEPREGTETQAKGRDVSYPVGLGAAAGSAPLHILALGNMSSTLKPNVPLMERFAKKNRHVDVVKSLEIPLDTLDHIAGRDKLRVDAIKVDTQGSELGILEGAAAVIGSDVLLAEIEVSFIPRYQGQALFRDIDSFMTARGFRLIDINRPKRYRWGNKAGVGNLSLGHGLRPGQLAYADAIYVLDDEAVAARLAGAADGGAMVTRLLLLLLAYGKPDQSAALFDAHGSHLTPAVREAFGGYYKSLARWPLSLHNLHAALDWLARKT